MQIISYSYSAYSLVILPVVSVVEHAVFQLNPHPPGGGSLRNRLRMSDYQTRG